MLPEQELQMKTRRKHSINRLHKRVRHAIGDEEFLEEWMCTLPDNK
jgi:hypothetical protein